MAFFTFLLEFRGGSYVSQVQARDERAAVSAWAVTFATDKLIGRSTRYVVSALLKEVEGENYPVGLTGLQSVWFVSSTVGGDHAAMNIVRTAGS